MRKLAKLYLKLKNKGFNLFSYLGIFVGIIFFGNLFFSTYLYYEVKPKPKKITDKIEFVENENLINNMRELKQKAIDSLIDNKIATPENFKKIELLYPDSLCDCNGIDYKIK